MGLGLEGVGRKYYWNYSSISREKDKYVELLKFEKEYACTFKKKLWYFLNTKDENTSQILSYKDGHGSIGSNSCNSRWACHRSCKSLENELAYFSIF